MKRIIQICYLLEISKSRQELKLQFKQTNVLKKPFTFEKNANLSLIIISSRKSCGQIVCYNIFIPCCGLLVPALATDLGAGCQKECLFPIDPLFFVAILGVTKSTLQPETPSQNLKCAFLGDANNLSSVLL